MSNIWKATMAVAVTVLVGVAEPTNALGAPLPFPVDTKDGMEKLMKIVAERVFRQNVNNAVMGGLLKDIEAAKRISGQITGVEQTKDIDETTSQLEVTTKAGTWLIVIEYRKLGRVQVWNVWIRDTNPLRGSPPFFLWRRTTWKR